MKYHVIKKKHVVLILNGFVLYHKLLVNFLSWQYVAVREKLFIKSTKIAVYLDPDRVAWKDCQEKPAYMIGIFIFELMYKNGYGIKDKVKQLAEVSS